MKEWRVTIKPRGFDAIMMEIEAEDGMQAEMIAVDKFEGLLNLAFEGDAIENIDWEIIE